MQEELKEDDKRLLEAIQQVARERDVLYDPRWDALAKGTLSATDEAALREEAERSPDMKEAYALFRPFDAKTKEAMIARLALGRPALPKAPRWRRAAVLLAAATLVAGLGVWAGSGGPPLEPVPAYAIAVVGGEKKHLGGPADAGAPPSLEDTESRLEITLRPTTSVKGALEARAWLVDDHRATRWYPPIEVRPNGVVIIAGTKGALFQGIPPGSWEIVVAVGRREAMPDDAAIFTERSADHPTGERACRILRTTVILRGAKGAKSEEPADPRAPRPVPSPLEVELGGCDSVRTLNEDSKGRGGIACEISAGHKLTLWVKAPPEAVITVDVDDAASWKRPGAWRPPLVGLPVNAVASEETGTPMQGGRRIAVTVPDGADTLRVTTEQGGACTWDFLALVPREPVAALKKADELRHAKPDEAEALLLPLLSDNRTWVRGRALGMLARIEQKIERKRELFAEAMDLHDKAGRISEKVVDGITLVNALIGNREFAEARRVLDRIQPLEAKFPQGRALALYYRARLALSVGDLRAALRFLNASKEIAYRLDARGHLVDVLQFEAEVLLKLGRSGDAMDRDKQGDDLSRWMKPCQRAQFLNNAGWHAILVAESLEGVTDTDPLPALREALTIHQGPCNKPGEKRGVLTNLAIASIKRGHVDEARDYLDQARTALPGADDETQAWWMIVEARIALAIGRSEQALRSYEKSAEIAARASLPDVRGRSVLEMAQTLDALGRANEARRAYSDADELLDKWSLLAPLGEGRESFLARYEASTSKRVDFLLRRAEQERAPAAWIEEAATASRRGRARILGSLQWLDRLDALSPSDHVRWDRAVADYRLGLDALRATKASHDALLGDARKAAAEEEMAENKRLHDAFEEALSMAPRALDNALLPLPPAPGEVMLHHQRVEGGWVGFAISRDRVAFRRLAAMDRGAKPEKIAERLLDPFGDVLEGAERIRFAPHSNLSGVDFHNLPFRGQRLVERFTVTYGVDLARVRGALPDSSASPLAILVANPSSDAPGTSRAASHVKRALESSGWRVELIEREKATHEAVVAALGQEGVKLFFYAGHGLYQGRDGWESALRLAGDERFTVADVMALSRVPPKVVLSGCQTAKTGEGTPAQGLGLAQAFVVAGANEVVATARDVEDKLAEQVIQALFNKGEGDALLPGRDLAVALREAQRVVAKGHDAGDWAAFRALVP